MEEDRFVDAVNNAFVSLYFEVFWFTSWGILWETLYFLVSENHLHVCEWKFPDKTLLSFVLKSGKILSVILSWIKQQDFHIC